MIMAPFIDTWRSMYELEYYSAAPSDQWESSCVSRLRGVLRW